MKKTLFLLFVALITYSCVQDSHLKPIVPNYLLHDNSSKVWVINHVFFDGKDEVPMSFKYKTMLVFHKSGTIKIYKINDISANTAKVGKFDFSVDPKKIRIDYNNEKVIFEIESISEEKVKLKSIRSKNKHQYSMELISFPEI